MSLPILPRAEVFEASKYPIEMCQAAESASEANIGDGFLRFRQLLLRLGNAARLNETAEPYPGGLPEHVRKMRGCETGIARSFAKTQRGISKAVFDELATAADFLAFQLRLQVSNPLGALSKLPSKQLQQSHHGCNLFLRQIDRPLVGNTQFALGNL